MIKKIKNYLLHLLWEPSGTALCAFCIMLLLCVGNIVNSTLLFSTNSWMLLIIPISFIPPLMIFMASREGKRYVPTHHLALPKKYHVPTILYATVLLILGSLLLKLLFIEGRYTEFSLYGAFFAHRDGTLLCDIYLLLAFCIIPPVLEGLVYRGIFITEHDRRGRFTATLVSALFFALMGFSFEELPQRLFAGILLCITLYATSSIAITVAMHILYNIFAVFVEPTLVSLKNVSSNVTLFTFILAITVFFCAFVLFSHLSRLYGKYSRDKNYNNFTKTTPRERVIWHLAELLLSPIAIACYVLFIITAIILKV